MQADFYGNTKLATEIPLRAFIIMAAIFWINAAATIYF